MGTAPGTAPRADGTSIAIQNYPSYLLHLFSPSQVAPYHDAIIPKALYGGLTNVVGTWVPLYFAQFDSSQAAALGTLPAPLSVISANEGHASVTVLTDPTATVASPSPITDFCTPLNVTTVLLGKDPSNTFTRATNPAAVGTGFILQRDASLRDLDQDGLENQFDTCPLVANISGDPRLTGSAGPNGNGIDGACDTSRSSSNDVDSDNFLNRQDNCPLISNPLQTESELGVSQPDNGPQVDDIGDSCDTGTSTFMQNGQSVTVNLGTTVSNGRYLVKENVIAKCFGGTDLDKDGYCTAGTGTLDTADDPSTACGLAVPANCAVRHAAWSGVPHPGLNGDSDKDGFSDTMETHLGTDADEVVRPDICGQRRSAIGQLAV